MAAEASLHPTCFALAVWERALMLVKGTVEDPWCVKRTTAGTSWALPAGAGDVLESITVFTQTLQDCPTGYKQTFSKSLIGSPVRKIKEAKKTAVVEH